jgi:nucleolar MIF4G domain-containing protein 1
VLTTEPLRISLSDLLTADSRGKWWLVGAGWSGNPLVDRQEQKAKEKPKKVKQPALEQEEQLLEVAKKQGMNTDIRRSIFVVLMTSEVSRTS